MSALVASLESVELRRRFDDDEEDFDDDAFAFDDEDEEEFEGDEFEEDDELIEVTPDNIRLRKRVLPQTERRKAARAAARVAGAS